MKIKKLEVVGFKSFVDPTVVNFDHDVTAIVGPNGCGKSNIVDAIKWVMGEQSASRLRGRSMDDIIFNGSETRGPHGFAEVSITFENADGLAPPEYREWSEIMVTRRLDRQGRSDYMINKTPVRLMDITNLFLGTGVGRRAYSIIEQGRIGYIVSSKPADRRLMIEEAAGITKFKVRKRAAERKMESTRQNLIRIGDIVAELEKNLASLKRQAQKAERYKRYREEVRDNELWIGSFKWFELDAMARMARHALLSAEATADGAKTALVVREAEVESERVDVDRLGTIVQRAETRTYELDNRVMELEGRIDKQLERLSGLEETERLAERELTDLDLQRTSLAEERDAIAAMLLELESAEAQAESELSREDEQLERRKQAVEDAETTVSAARARQADAQTRIARAETVLASYARRREEGRARIEKLISERDQLDARVSQLLQERVVLEARLGGLKGGREQTAERKAQVESELRDLREAIGESDAKLETLREDHAAKRSRLRSLRELQQRFEGVGQGVRALMTRYRETRDDDGILGLVADRVDCPAGLTTALAGALGDQLSHVVVDSRDAAASALAYLRDDAQGRATLITKRPPRVVGRASRVPEHPGIIGRFLDLVKHEPSDRDLMSHLLGDCVVVDSLNTAFALSASGVTATLVTVEGDVVRPDGTMTGGVGDDQTAHMLEMKREIRELEVSAAQADELLGAAVHRHSELRTGIAERQAEIDSARSAAHDAEIAMVETEKDIRSTHDEEARLRERRGSVEAERRDLEQALDRADDEEDLAKREIEGAKASEQAAQNALAEAEGISAQRRQGVEEQAARVTEMRVSAAQAQERAESSRGAVERLVRSIEELGEREDRLRGDVADGAREQGRIIASVFSARESLGDTVRDAVSARDALQKQRVSHERARDRLAENEADLKTLRTDIDGKVKEVNDLTLRDRELVMETDHLLEQIFERHRVDVRHVLNEYHCRPLPDAAVHERVKELLRLIERMGEINLMAIEEFDERSTRYEYLSGQQNDLEQALVTLERTIRKMNRESRTMFKEAFVAINERFKRVFPAMFRGGKAELRLSDPNNLLESGIDIAAQPPGKRLGSLELMSGGEKALTAVALIFSIFQYKPSPFCLLDEVDAPLDEANIGRFAQAIRQMTDRSQFIVITHSKRTMEYADVLYGVTMEQPGVSSLVSVELRGDKRPAEMPSDEAGAAVVA